MLNLIKSTKKSLFTYECYLANNKADAMAFLNKKTVEKSLYYIVVETPEGSFGRDIYHVIHLQNPILF